MSEITFLINDRVVKNFVEHAESNLPKTVKRSRKKLFLPLQLSYEIGASANGCAEIKMKQILLKKHVDEKRNLFLIDPEFINILIQNLKLKKVTVTLDVAKDIAALEALKKYNAKFERRDNINFKKILIPIGSTLHYCKDPSITCVVESENKVIFEQKIMYITTATIIIRERLGEGISINGFKYWKFENEILDDRRKRLEREV